MAEDGAPPRARRVASLEGVVQGVGFRPYLLRLAREEGLDGLVRNEGCVVHLEVEGPPEALARLAARLVPEAPPAARLTRVAWREAAPTGRAGFIIDESATSTRAALPIPPDLATCPACRAEIADPGARRHAYPFTSCTACGPRYTIVEALPYDRARTTMRGFPLCAACAAEYGDETDRRHHAQPLACPACGPALRLLDRQGRALASKGEALTRAAQALRGGAVLALKGLGGYQLLCDASSASAVATLRERKRRPDKALAVMVSDLAGARVLAAIDDEEARALAGSEGPIVLVRPRAGAPLAAGIAPRMPRLGLMLPTTPLHHLLLEAVGLPLVCTSGNLHEEPIAIDDADALARLSGIAELFLAHDRPIARRADDGVVQRVAGRVRTLRLGRGLGPTALPVALDGVPRLALGGHLKCAPALALEDRVILWPHVGDLDSPLARAALEEAVADLERFLGVAPREVVCDRHPDYATTILAEGLGLPVRRVAHHLAHVGACLAEHGAEEALGFAWDGVGLGEGGALSGGEVLRVSARRGERVGHLRPFRLPGGEAASRDGRRSLAGLLAASPHVAVEMHAELTAFVGLARSPRLAPETTSVGRLFDAAAALLGVRERSSFEGQAAMELEALASPGAAPYPVRLMPGVGAAGVLDWAPLLEGLLAERADPPRAASRLHATLVAWIVEATAREGAARVALSGGCFQNALLAEGAVEALSLRGVEVLLPERAPASDGGLALGQAWVAGGGELTASSDRPAGR